MPIKNIIGPWSGPDAQAPPLPTALCTNWSPVSRRKVYKTVQDEDRPTKFADNFVKAVSPIPPKRNFKNKPITQIYLLANRESNNNIDGEKSPPHMDVVSTADGSAKTDQTLMNSGEAALHLSAESGLNAKAAQITSMSSSIPPQYFNCEVVDSGEKLIECEDKKESVLINDNNTVNESYGQNLITSSPPEMSVPWRKSETGKAGAKEVPGLMTTWLGGRSTVSSEVIVGPVGPCKMIAVQASVKDSVSQQQSEKTVIQQTQSKVLNLQKDQTQPTLQDQPVSRDVPWRSPQVKRKVVPKPKTHNESTNIQPSVNTTPKASGPCEVNKESMKMGDKVKEVPAQSTSSKAAPDNIVKEKPMEPQLKSSDKPAVSENKAPVDTSMNNTDTIQPTPLTSVPRKSSPKPPSGSPKLQRKNKSTEPVQSNAISQMTTPPFVQTKQSTEPSSVKESQIIEVIPCSTEGEKQNEAKLEEPLFSKPYEANQVGAKIEAQVTIEPQEVVPPVQPDIPAAPPPPARSTSLENEPNTTLESNQQNKPDMPPPLPYLASIGPPKDSDENAPFKVLPDMLPIDPEPDSPDFVLEPVTSRIQRFEQQLSIDAEKDKVGGPPAAKPVGPWVKKTSSGPVSNEDWATSPVEGWPEPPALELQHPMKPSPAQSRPVNPPAASAASSVQQQRIQKIQQEESRPRRQSSGDFTTSYVKEDDHRIGMPTEAPGPSPALAIPPAPLKADVGGGPLFDPWCDEKNPRVIQFQDISAAAFKIKSGIMNTPCTKSNMSAILGMDIFFKKEFNQFTGSFKERGARYTLLCLPESQKATGVIAASAGNHALALSYHGQKLGISVTVVMPLVAPIMKVQACRQYGANILVTGKDICECKEIALKIAREKGLTYINGYDHPHILAGQGTMGLEIVEQVPDIDAVVIPVGGGGLIAGVALAVKSLYPHIKVIGVESDRCASFNAALQAGHPVTVPTESSLADGLAVPKVGVNAFATAKNLVDKVVSVREEWIAIAILRLVEIEKAVVEGAGATALAALLAGELPELKGKRVVIPLCGGNIDTTILGRCLERGLAADGRLVKFTVTVSDRPGGIADLTRLLANLGVSIKDMMHERAWIKSDIFSVEVKVVAETRDYEHHLELKTALEAKYTNRLRFHLPENPPVQLLQSD